jgi:hypothetical protein
MAGDINFAAANVVLDALYDVEFPAGSVLELRTGEKPGAENAATGTVLASITSPATPWNAAASGQKTKNGTWSTTSSAAGVIGYYRFRNAADTRREEGTVTVVGGGGDATVNDVTIGSIGMTVTVSTFTKTL